MKDSLRMKPVRPFTRGDIPQVADLFQRLLLNNSSPLRMLSTTALPDYFEEIFFNNPWYDEALPSLVYQGSEEKIIGFLGVVPRRMLLRGQPISVAISLHFMVEPESRSSLAGVQLLKTFFSGPQDLSLTDGAGHVGRRVWEGVGGTTAWSYSLNWTRILRPTRHAFDLLARRRTFLPLIRALSPFCNLADSAAARMLPNYFPNAAVQYSEEELDADTLLNYLPQFSKVAALQPVYDDYSLRWLLAQAEQMKVYGTFKKVLLRDHHREVVGWFMYYLKPDGMSTVFQFVAKKNATDEVFDCLFNHAWRNGAAAISGRLYPRYMQELSDRRCYFNRKTGWVLIHSNNDELLNIIQRGDVFLTGLEGEWGLLF